MRRLIMTGEDRFELTRQEIKDGIVPALADFMNQRTYAFVSRAAFRLVEQGMHQALYAPAVKYALDATLGMLTQPQVERRLPREIVERERIAVHFSDQAVNAGMFMGVFKPFIEQNPYLGRVPLDFGDIEALTGEDDKYIRSLAYSPFFDVCLVAGGAFRVLKKEGVQAPAVEIISRSKGLMDISKVNKGYSEKVSRQLGLPYAHPHLYTLIHGEVGLEVDFIPEVHHLLDVTHIKGRGCPAGKMPSDQVANQTLLRDYWEQIVYYLIPGDATADSPDLPDAPVKE